MSVQTKTLEAKTPVILTDHYLAEKKTSRGKDIVIQGIIDRDTLANLGYDTYQRSLGTVAQRRKLFVALKNGKPLTTVELGMRGARTSDKGRSLVLRDPVYVIDGRQRIGTLLEWLEANPDDDTSFINATVHINTDFEWEQTRFVELNLGQRPVAPSKILDNYRTNHPSIAALYGLSMNDKSFAVHGRVCWEQNMARSDLITARTLALVTGHLHSHLVPSRSYSIEPMTAAMENIVRTFGLQTMRNNVRDFFDIVDGCWGIRSVQYRGGLIQLRTGFLMAVARLLSDHHDFWTEHNKRLEVSAGDRSRLGAMILDQNVARLAEGSSKSRMGLRWHMIQHINNKRRGGKIRERQVVTRQQDVDLDDVA